MGACGQDGLASTAAIKPWRSAFGPQELTSTHLPQGLPYQPSYYHPFVGEGEVIRGSGPGIARRVRIERIHLGTGTRQVGIHEWNPVHVHSSRSHPHRPWRGWRNRSAAPTSAAPRGGGPTCSPSCARSCAYLRHLQRRHAELCNLARGRQRLGLPPATTSVPGDARDFSHARHAAAEIQEHELHALHPKPPSDYGARRQIAHSEDCRRHRAGNPPLHPGRRRDPAPLRSKEEAHGLPATSRCPDLLPLPRSSSPGFGRRSPPPCRKLPDAKKAALREGLSASPNTDGRRAHPPSCGTPAFSRPWRAGRDGQAGRRTGSSTSSVGRLRRTTCHRAMPALSPARLGQSSTFIASDAISAKIAKEGLRDRSIPRTAPGPDASRRKD